MTTSPPTVSIALDYVTPSYLDGKEFLEIINPNCVDALINSDFLKKVFDPSNGMIYENEKQQLKAYRNCFDDAISAYVVEYRMPKHKLGRLNLVGALGLTSFSKKVRNTMIKDNYIDLDLSNAQPTILWNICYDNNINCPQLTKLIENRELILNDVMTTYCVSRGQAKKLFLRLSFYGTFKGWCIDNKLDEDLIPNDYILSLTAELGTIATTIAKQNKGLYEKCRKLKRDKNQSNILGSFMSYYLQHYEQVIMSAVIKWLCEDNDILYLSTSSIPVLTYEYDGIKISIHSVNKYEGGIGKLIEDMENIVLNKTGFQINFEEKKIEEFYNIEYELYDIDAPLNGFEKMVNQFEKTHSKIINNNVFIREYKDEYIVMSKNHIENAYSHMECVASITTKGKKGKRSSSFIKEWFQYPKMRTYDALGVYPSDIKCPENEFNLWKSFEMENVTKWTHNEKGLQSILNHILILCNNDKNVADYFCLWIAQMIQFPSVKSNCPVFISKEGAGKGSLLKLFTKMLGARKVFESTNPSRDVWGDFNGNMSNTFLVNLNEISKADTMKAEGYLKALITDDTIVINNKGVNSYPIKSYHRFIITTNNDECITTTYDDRRKLIIRSSDELCGNKEYFNNLYSLLDDIDVIKSCYEYFKDLEGADTYNTLPIPFTEHQRILIEMAITPLERWVINFIEERNDNTEEVTETSKNCFQSFNNWKLETHTNYEMNYNTFCCRLKKNIQGIKTKKGRNENETVFDIQKIKQKYNIGCKIPDI